jgi:hypothetical protein
MPSDYSLGIFYMLFCTNSDNKKIVEFCGENNVTFKGFYRQMLKVLIIVTRIE